MAVGVSAVSGQPASPATLESTSMPRFANSVKMPWKSAGVAAGGVVEMVPQAATSQAATRSPRRDAARSRLGDDTPARLSPRGRDRRSALPGAALGVAEAGDRVAAVI